MSMIRVPLSYYFTTEEHDIEAMAAWQIRRSTAEACRVEELRSQDIRANRWRAAEWEAANTDPDGYLLWWNGGSHGAWRPYEEYDYFGINAVRTTAPGERYYSPETDTEQRLVLVDPMKDVPDNAHWKGWVW